MVTKFDIERARVAFLLERLGITPEDYSDPNSSGVQESGADVIAVIDSRRIGIQVTDIDTGSARGKARAAEKCLAREAEAAGTTYGTWAQNDTSIILHSIVQTVRRKARMSFAGFDEFWLLMCAGVPEFGATGATLIMTPWLSPDALDAGTQADLAVSKYARVFIHAILGVEEQALYEWSRGSGWSKSTVALQATERAPDFWTHKDDPELLRDPEGWADQDVIRVLAELRQAQEKSR